MTSNTNVSVIKSIEKIIDKKIDLTQSKTTSSVVLYVTGSTLSPIDLGQVSY